jgi:hypothetical protein
VTPQRVIPVEQYHTIKALHVKLIIQRNQLKQMCILEWCVPKKISTSRNVQGVVQKFIERRDATRWIAYFVGTYFAGIASVVLRMDRVAFTDVQSKTPNAWFQ